MPHIKVNDISMYYEQQGQGEPVVFVSGFGHDHTPWLEVAKQLNADHQVILFDNRGAGQTDVPAESYSIEQMAADVAGLCEKIGIKRAHFVGNSMGGFILQVLGAKYPELVKSLVISNSALNTQFVFNMYLDANLQLFKANAPLSALIQASCCWTFSYRFLSQENMLDQLIQLTLSNPYPLTVQGFEGQYAALKYFDSSEWAHAIGVPALVFGADQDMVFRESSVKLLAEKISGAEYYCFRECGHLPLIEYPAKFAELVRAFIDKTML